MESIIFRIMNLKELHQLEEEIEKMSDAQERDARTRLIEQIVEKITDYDVHVREYAYQQAAKHYTNQFRWHLFSFELLPAVQGDQARTAFDEIKKGELYLFFDYADETYRVKNAHLLTANVNDARRD